MAKEVNVKLGADRLYVLISRVDSFDKLETAKEWIMKNEVITVDEFDDMMMALAYISRELHSGRAMK